MTPMVPTDPAGLKSVSPVARAAMFASTSPSASASNMTSGLMPNASAPITRMATTLATSTTPHNRGASAWSRPCAAAADGRPMSASWRNARTTAPPSSRNGSKLPASSRPSAGHTSHELKSAPATMPARDNQGAQTRRAITAPSNMPAAPRNPTIAPVASMSGL